MTRQYSDRLSASVNRKGVLDIDTVKGCSAGIATHGEHGCYGACYAAKIAKYRGIDFSVSVVRKPENRASAASIESAVKNSPFGFFRVGTMGDPSLAWAETVDTVEWLAPYATPIIVTKHWRSASDSQLGKLAAVGAVVNTSVSALDPARLLYKRLYEIERFLSAGVVSVARIVSCDFNNLDPVGESLSKLQARLFEIHPHIDNPLRCDPSHPLARSGVIRLHRVTDLSSDAWVSIPHTSSTYLGHCSGCNDLCGAGLVSTERPKAPQGDLFGGSNG